MEVLKIYRPVILEPAVVKCINENDPIESMDEFKVGAKLLMIVFDDEKFSTPPPKLPLKYRLKNIFDRKEG